MSKPNNQLVHENEAQRRHARVRIPARIYVTETGSSQPMDLIDLSVSGFCVEAPPGTLREHTHHTAELRFDVNNVSFRLPVHFTVLHSNPTNGRAGCIFDQLGQEELSLLHLFIGKYLTGELVTSGDILSTLNRENFTRARSQSKPQPMNGWGKARAIAGSALAACAGLIAFGLIASHLYQHFFVTRAVTAMIDIDHEVIESPSSGYIEFVEQASGKVVKGKPIATISSPVLDYLNGIGESITGRDDLRSFLPEQIHSVVNSPYHGTIIENQTGNDHFVTKGAPLFTLAKEGDTPYIRAIFRYSDADRLPVGKTVSLQFPGAASQFPGTIDNISVDMNGSSARLIAIIKPDAVLMYNKIHKPVHVLVSSSARELPVVSSILSNLPISSTAVAQSR